MQHASAGLLVQEGVVVVAVVEVGQAAPAAALQVLPAALRVGLPPGHWGPQGHFSILHYQNNNKKGFELESEFLHFIEWLK